MELVYNRSSHKISIQDEMILAVNVHHSEPHRVPYCFNAAAIFF